MSTTTTPKPVLGVVVRIADPLFTLGERQAWPGSCRPKQRRQAHAKDPSLPAASLRKLRAQLSR
jgi:hypothetical protein